MNSPRGSTLRRIAENPGHSRWYIDRFEAMGYEVRGKSEEEIADVLHQPPTRGTRGASGSKPSA